MFALYSFLVLTQKRDIWMYGKEAYAIATDAYLVYVYSHIAYSKHKKAIFRWMTRKKNPQGS